MPLLMVAFIVEEKSGKENIKESRRNKTGESMDFMKAETRYNMVSISVKWGYGHFGV